MEFCYFHGIAADSSISFISAKADIEIEHNQSKESYTMHIRQKGSDTLWISFTGMLGIEGLRLLVTQDSTYIVHKLDKLYYVISNNDDNGILPLSLSLDDWKMLLWNQIYPIDSTTLIQNESERKIYTFYCPRYIKNLSVDGHETLLDAKFNCTGFQCWVDFHQYRNLTPHHKIAYTKKLEAKSGEETWKIAITMKSHEINKPLPIPFDVKKYVHTKD